MEDRYLFKAKFDDSDRWVKGQLVEVNDTYLIIPNYANKILAGWFSASNIIKVRKDTICQCTGLKDKNGDLIWENDIVKAKYADGFEEITEVAYSKNGYSPYLNEYECEGCCCYCEVAEVEVIGNIFDNPELLESEG